MKNLIQKLLSSVLALLLIFSAATPVFAAENPSDYIRQIINYYRYYSEEAETDLECLENALTELDPDQGKAWGEIIDHWIWLNRDMIMDYDVLPDGLPEDDSLCIVVLGYELTNNGNMKDELIGRLEVALASAEKYPNAYIACTGGGTARNNKTVTEAGRMAEWLLEQGVAEERIIVEDRSYSTIQNAQKTLEVLADAYPWIAHLAIVTSDYHIPRASLLFQAQSALTGLNFNIVSQAAFRSEQGGTEGVYAQARDLAELVGVRIDDMKKPALSQLSHITVEGPSSCDVGMELALTVTAHYDSGLSRTVTRYSNFSGFDLSQPGQQTVTVRYAEGDLIATATYDVEFIAPDTEPPETAQETIPPTEAPVPAEDTHPETEFPIIPFVILAVLLALLILLIRLKIRHK